MSSVVSSRTIEDWLVYVAPILTFAAGLNFTGLLPGVSGFIIAATIGSIAKTLTGFAQDPHIKNWEDWLSLLITFLGFLGTAFTGNPQLIIYGTIIGLIAKGLPSLKNGLNIEDVMLLIGAVIAGYGAAFGSANITSLGLLISLLGKTLPSIATNGQAGAPAPKTAPAPVPPTPTPTPAP